MPGKKPKTEPKSPSKPLAAQKKIIEKPESKLPQAYQQYVATFKPLTDAQIASAVFANKEHLAGIRDACKEAEKPDADRKALGQRAVKHMARAKKAGRYEARKLAKSAPAEKKAVPQRSRKPPGPYIYNVHRPGCPCELCAKRFGKQHAVFPTFDINESRWVFQWRLWPDALSALTNAKSEADYCTAFTAIKKACDEVYKNSAQN